ncbi:MAG: alpha/beta fold hydrolase [Betaproteobacteria bacterium]|nr:alpha/beta fold hydrolase [Betaproteobacteria bacterium]
MAAWSNGCKSEPAVPSPTPIEKSLIVGDAGAIELASQIPDAPRAVGVIAHPHPLFGGTMDNKVVTTLARAFFEAGAATWRFNFRGIGRSEGQHDEGRGETADMLKVIAHAVAQHPGLPLWLAGFSFGGAVTQAASEQVTASEMILVAPSFQRLAQWQNRPEGSAATPENTLIIHGEKDETVALADSFDWARARNIPVTVVPGADHFFHQRLHIIRQIVGRWLTA